jgi:antitoxin component YwqK of YwqJK toxin-antitoxin module
MSEKEIQIIEDVAGRRLVEVEYEDGRPCGVSRRWSPEGVLIEEAGVEGFDYHGHYRSWWENGKKKEEGRYFRGRRIGLNRWYSETGFLLKEEDYGPGGL